MIDDLAGLRAFVAVAECGSFSAAGRRLNVVPSTISKHVSALEERIKGRLIARSTAGLALTELGLRFRERCLTILDEVEQAETEIGDYQAEPQGLLRVSAAPVFATRHLGPTFARFTDMYPRVTLDVTLTTTSEDLISAGIDVAVRIGKNLDPGLIALKLAPNIRVYCAAPAYLAQHGVPTKAADLADHNCLLVRGVVESAKWQIRGENGETENIVVSGAFVSDNGDLVAKLLLAGAGIGHLPLFMVYEDLQTGSLIELFPASRFTASHIYAVYPERRNLPLKTRAFLDHLRAEFRTPPRWAT
jgi:DNA-binding transcriptional LysR family regulator